MNVNLSQQNIKCEPRPMHFWLIEACFHYLMILQQLQFAKDLHHKINGKL